MLVSLALAATAVVLLGRSTFTGVPGVLSRLRVGWALLAVATTIASVSSLGVQQRALLALGGPRLPLRSVVATTYAGNAISVSVPVVGSQLSVAYSFRRFVTRGNDPAATMVALVVSGVVSSTAFAGIVISGAVTSGDAGFAVAGALSAAGLAAALGAVLLGLHRPTVRTRLAATLHRAEDRLRRRSPAARTDWSSQLDRLAALHLRRRSLATSLTWALANWGADIACLALALEAVGAPVPWRGLILAWAAGSGAASLGLTPAGLGVVEAALALALVGAGVPRPAAISAVLLYRLLSLWLSLAIGAAVLARDPLRGSLTNPT